MKKWLGVICTLALVPYSAAAQGHDHHDHDHDHSGHAHAEEQQGGMHEGHEGIESEAEMMANFAKYGTPGPEHERLAEGAGTWKVEQKFFPGPGLEPMVSEGKEKCWMSLDGRVMQFEYEGDAMGMPFTGFGMMGYDRVRDEYWSTWNDSMSTGIMMATGTYDEDTKTYTLKGSSSDPFLGEEDREYTYKIQILSKDKQLMTMWHGDRKTMEMHYTRVSEE